jgi:hypothetical protein
MSGTFAADCRLFRWKVYALHLGSLAPASPTRGKQYNQGATGTNQRRFLVSAPPLQFEVNGMQAVQDLLSTPPEDLASVLLTLAKGMVQNGMFLPETVNDIAIAVPHALNGQPGYGFHNRQQIEPLLSRAWSWIERNDLITPAGGMNGRLGWMMFTPRGEQVSDAQDIQRLREAADFPRWMIHPSIAEKA